MYYWVPCKKITLVYYLYSWFSHITWRVSRVKGGSLEELGKKDFWDLVLTAVTLVIKVLLAPLSFIFFYIKQKKEYLPFLYLTLLVKIKYICKKKYFEEALCYINKKVFQKLMENENKRKSIFVQKNFWNAYVIFSKPNFPTNWS